MSDPGWYPDPHDPAQARYWTGTAWSDRTRALDDPAQGSGRSWSVPVLVAGVAALLAVAVAVVLLVGRDEGSDVEVIAPAADATTAATVAATSSSTTTTTSTTTTPTTSATGAATSPGIRQSLDAYVAGINSGDYPAAYGRLGPNAQALTSFEEFSSGNSTSQITDLAVEAVRPAGEGVRAVDVTFRSTQAATQGPNGQTCTVWHLTYTMVQGADGVWRIDRSDNRPGSPAGC